MSNTDVQTTFHRIMAGSLLLAGFAVLTLATQTHLFAQATSQGSSLRNLPTAPDVRYEAAPTVLPAIPVSSGWSEGTLIVIGMVLILIGLGIHAALTLRTERPVHVTDVSGKKSEGPSRLRRNIDVIWIERKFRV